jgi:D-glycerate 3-kinase
LALHHILEHYEGFRDFLLSNQKPTKPFHVGFSGCQGSGKTTTCETLATILRQEPYNLSVVVFSLDDLYLTREDQKKLAISNPTNRLLELRGQFGSHDLDLARRLFKDLDDAHRQYLESPTTAPAVGIPRYDKSLHHGLGDRLPESQWTKVFAPFDIIIFEGWSLGFKHLPDATLPEAYRNSPEASKFTFEEVSKINDNVKLYEDAIYPHFDIFCHMAPTSLENVYQWRLQQEHSMKATRGVGGMSDQQVRAFVDTYMPAYGLFLPNLTNYGFYHVSQDQAKPYEGALRSDGQYSAPLRHLKLVLDLKRRVVYSSRRDEPDRWVPYSLRKWQNKAKYLYSSPSMFRPRGSIKSWSVAAALLIGVIAFGYRYRREVLTWGSRHRFISRKIK